MTAVGAAAPRNNSVGVRTSHSAGREKLWRPVASNILSVSSLHHQHNYKLVSHARANVAYLYCACAIIKFGAEKIKKFKTHQSTSKVIKTNDTASKFQVLTNWCSYCAEKYCIMAHFFLYLHMQ